MEEYGSDVVISPGGGLVFLISIGVLFTGERFILVSQTSCDVPAMVSATETRTPRKFIREVYTLLLLLTRSNSVIGRLCLCHRTRKLTRLASVLS